MKMSVEINGEKFRTFSDIYAEDIILSNAERKGIELNAAIIRKLVAFRDKEGLSWRDITSKSAQKVHRKFYIK